MQGKGWDRDVRDGCGERTVGGVVAPGGEDVPALDESGLSWLSAWWWFNGALSLLTVP